MTPGEGGERLAAALDPYLGDHSAYPGGVLLAVSGGPDSTALMHAAAAMERGRISVATVDHGLRPQAAREARDVGQLASRLGLRHDILCWDTRPDSGIQAAAREARYRLLAEHAGEIGAGLILTAHTADDQAETVLMRLIAGSGPAGLAGMRRERRLADGIRLTRPFLEIPKADLVDYCERHSLPFIRDPSNMDERFTRARLRRLMPLLAAEGLNTSRLNRLAERLARDEAALSHLAAGLVETARRPAGPGALALDGGALLDAPQALALRAIDLALETVQPDPARPVPRRLERLERLCQDALLPALACGTRMRRTLRGAVVEATAKGLVIVAPAPPRQTATTTAQCSQVAGASDLLGKGEGRAYIGGACPE